jgi:amino acid adenylation domain-containing protein/FkbH-like protein
MMKEIVGYRLSPQQRRFWSLRQQARGMFAQAALLITGGLDAARLREAVRRAANQDSIYKSTYLRPSDGEPPLQVLNEEAAFSFAEVRLPSLRSVEALLREEQRRGFDLRNGPLLYASLASLPDGQWLLVLTSPAICADLWSLGALAGMVVDAYRLLSNGRLEWEFDNLPYLQFSEWQNRLLESDEAEEGRRYWYDRTTTTLAAPLPFENESGGDEDSSPSFFDWTLDSAQVASVRRLLDGTDCTTEQFLFLCWQVVLRHLTSGQPQETGYYDSLRNFEELKNTLGLLSKCLPASAPFDGQTSFWDALHRLGNSLEERRAQANFFLPEEPPAYAFEFAEGVERYEAAEATFTVLSRHSLRERHKLKLDCFAQGDDVRCTIEYYAREFDPEAVEFIAHAFRAVLEQCIINPQAAPGTLSLLDDYYTERLLRGFNDTAKSFARRDKSVAEIFEEQAVKYPDRVAVVCGEASLTYAQMNERAEALAAYLRGELHVRPGDRLGLMCAENESLVVCMLGIIKAGGAYVPLDPTNPKERLNLILQDGELKALITESHLQSRADGYAGLILYLDALPCGQEGDRAADVSSGPQRTVEDVLYVIYTSGTTGRPKGTLIRDGSLVNYVCWLREAFSLKPSDSSVLLSSYAFDLGYTSLWGTLLNGGCLHLVPRDLVKKPEALISYIAERRISFIKTTPSLFHLIARAANADELRDSALHLVLLGGEEIQVEDLEAFIRLKPDVTLVNHYGPTEATIGAIAHRINTAQLSSYRARPVIGKPIANNKVYILDEGMRPAPPGIDGELFIAGAGLARGYWNRDDLTEEKFIANPFDPGTKMYRTGDVARWMPDGSVLFVGRRDDQVKIRGYRVELEEIRHALRQHSMISDAVLVASDVNGGGRELVAYFVAEADIALEELRDFLLARLPEYMLPAYFVPLKQFPLTPNGKLDKVALPDAAGATLRAGGAYLAPRSEIERKLVALWQQVLGREPVGVRDNFFELGGHSLKAIQFVTKLHRELKIKIELGEIFLHPTVEALSRAIDARAEAQFNEIVPLPERNYYDVSHAQQRLLVLSQFDEGSVAYNVPGACILDGALDVSAFRNAFGALIERHENLRTVFVEVGGEPKQKILSASATGFAVEVKDLRREPDADARVRELAEQEAARPFDLTRGPLLRATLLKTADETHVFIFNIHHIVSDGWSRGILVKELLTLYDAYLKGDDDPLPPLRIQYKDYVAWHNASYASQGAYWEEVYGEGVPVLEFPLDRERPRVQSFAGEVIRLSLPESLTAGLRRMAIEHNMTLNNLLLALYALLLAGYSAQEDVVVGSLVSGRNHSDLENLIGVFINFLPLRLFPSQGLSLEEFLRASNRTAIRAYENQDYPFDLLVEKHISRRDISRNPFFDTMINFHSEDELEGHARLINEQLPGLGLGVRHYELNSATSALDFRLDVRPSDRTLNFQLYYNSDLFERRSMELMLERCVRLIEMVLEDPGRKLGDYVLFTPEERQEAARKSAVNDGPAQALPVNVCASFVAEPVEEYMEYWGTEFEMNLKVSFAPYNQVFQQLLDDGGILRRNGGINVLLLRVEDWLRDLKDLSPAAQSAHLSQTYAELTHLLEHVGPLSSTPYLVGVAPASNDPRFGTEVNALIDELSAALRGFVAGLQGFNVLDMERMARLYAVEEVFDRRAEEVGHMPFTQEYYAALGTYLVRRIHAWKAPPFKVIVVDCDNTLWKGVCGEVGAEGVVVDSDCVALQGFLLEKYDEGFLLALCSKNNEEDVWAVFESRPEMLLRRGHVSAHRVNWRPKSANLAAIAEELNVGLDSLIFIDDSSFEAEEVAGLYPEVLSLVLPAEPGGYGDFLNHVWAFDRFVVTDEDKKRNAMMKAEQRRRDEQSRHPALSDFYRSLNIQLSIAPLDEKNVTRAAQLTRRTNQFNLNGVPLEEEYLKGLSGLPDALNWAVTVTDRFGEYGLVGLLLARVAHDSLIIETFLLSCRVLGRGVEDALLTELRKYCRARGLTVIEAGYKETAGNRPFGEFLVRSNWRAQSDEGTRSLRVEAIVTTNNYKVAYDGRLQADTC